MSKVRRVVRRIKRIPTLTELTHEAHSRGMTVKEYVDMLNQLNRNHEGKRNLSATYDKKPPGVN